MLSKIEFLESNYNLKQITYKGSSIWPFLRVYLTYSILGKGRTTTDSRTVLIVIKNLFYGFFNLFNKAEYIFFTDTANRKFINNKYYDRIDFLSEKYKKKIVFELTTTKFYKRNLIPTEHITSKMPLYILAKIIKKFVSIKKINNLQILEQLLKDNNIEFNINSFAKEYVSQIKVANLLIKLYNPKALVLTPSYTNFGFIDAFKSKGIKVVELQHGLINTKHLAYNFSLNINKDLFPDYLFSYGNFEKSVFNAKNNFIDENNVKPVGHFYMNYIKETYKKDKQLFSKLSNYRLSIAVTLQPNYENKLLDFISKVAKLNVDIAFVIIPRTYVENNFTENNIFLKPNIDCYQTVLTCDIHCTIFSSCAVEAIGLNKPNILVNIDNKSEEHIDFLINDNTSFIVNNSDEFNNLLNNLDFANIKFESQKYFKNNFENNINVEFDKIFNL